MKANTAALQKPASVLITGSAGFIGTNLTKTLLKKGFYVYGVDNFITGEKENIDPLLFHPRFQFFFLDICSKNFLEIFSKIKIDIVFHLACPTGVPNVQKMSEEMIHTNSIGTIQVMEIAKKHNAKVIFSSSSEIYGQPEVFPQNEHYNGNVDPIGLRSPYEEGKRFSECIIMTYVRKYKIDADIVRFFNVYGPGMSLKDERVLPQFFNSAKAGKCLTIYGDGSQKRTFLYIDDLIKGLLTVFEKGAMGEVYNIGSLKQITVKNLAENFIKILNYNNCLEFKPHFIEDHKSRLPSLEKINRLGWKETIGLNEGIKKMAKKYGFLK